MSPEQRERYASSEDLLAVSTSLAKNIKNHPYKAIKFYRSEVQAKGKLGQFFTLVFALVF